MSLFVHTSVWSLAFRRYRCSFLTGTTTSMPAELRNRCRRAGIHIGTIDALLAQLCIGHDLTMLTTDGDFRHVAKQSVLKVWSVSA